MMSMKRLFRSLIVAVAAVGVLGLAACKQAPKPKELTELERILGEEGANKVKEIPGGAKYYRKSRELRKAALDEWEDGNLKKARHYAVRGKIAYRTAEVIGKQAKAKERFEEADAKVKKINPQVQTLAKERDKLQSEVQALHRKVQAAQQKQAAERRKEIAAKSGSSSSNEGDRLAAQNKIQRALDAKEKALDVRANEFAKASYNKANNQLKSAQSLMQSSSESMDEVVATAEDAIKSFKTAAEEAKPKYEEAEAKKNPMQRLAGLKDSLQSEFGATQVEDVGRGVKVTIPALFAANSSNILGGKTPEVDAVAKLAKEYDEFKVVVDGYTREGNATENLAISQVRAKRVRDYLKDQGVADDRMSTNGHGQSRIKYPDSPGRNDRVEITFRLSN